MVLLSLTSFVQLVIVDLSGSVALFADALHNLADSATSIPIWIAFSLLRRGTTERFTYGYGKTEDFAGILVVLLIFVSACVAVTESVLRFLDPHPLTHPGWVVAAALVGFAGNEMVAMVRIRTGREIGSATLVADGQHSRIDGLTSLAVLIGVAGNAMGFPILDHLVGMVIALIILYIVWNTARSVWFRLIDGIEPEHLERIRRIALHHPERKSILRIRARRVGYRIFSEIDLSIDPDQSVREAHMIVQNLEKDLLREIPFLGDVVARTAPSEFRAPEPRESGHDSPVRIE